MSKITETEWRTELDRLRGRPIIQGFTSEQMEFLKYARRGDTPVPWIRVAELWAKHWTPLKEGALRKRYIDNLREAP